MTFEKHIEIKYLKEIAELKKNLAIAEGEIKSLQAKLTTPKDEIANDKYYDREGKKISLHQLVKTEPEWATNIIKYLKVKFIISETENKELNQKLTASEALRKGLSDQANECCRKLRVVMTREEEARGMLASARKEFLEMEELNLQLLDYQRLYEMAVGCMENPDSDRFFRDMLKKEKEENKE